MPSLDGAVRNLYFPHRKAVIFANSHRTFANVVGALASIATVIGCSKDSSSTKAQSASSSSATPSAAASAPVNALPIPSASVAAMVNPAGLPPYAGPTGSVEGTVFVDGDPAPDAPDQDFSACPAAAELYKKRFREAAPTGPNGARPLADAVVGVTGYAGFVPEQSAAVRVVFDKCTYGTRTVAMTFGQRLEVANKSDRAIAPGLDQAFSPALMIAPPHQNGDPVKIYPQHAGFFTVSDQLGPKHRVLDVYVLLFPTHAVTDTAGHYRIDGIPVGKADVSARLRTIGQESTQKIEIQAGVVQKVDLVLHYKAAPAAVDAGAQLKKPIP